MQKMSYPFGGKQIDGRWFLSKVEMEFVK